jgi:2-aminoadipate transaminase
VINASLELRHTFGPLKPGPHGGYDAPGPELS